MSFAYVLRSLTSGRSYRGYTTNLAQRLGQHDLGITRSAKNRGSWELVHSEEFARRAEAMRREHSLKNGQGREELKAICIRKHIDPSG